MYHFLSLVRDDHTGLFHLGTLKRHGPSEICMHDDDSHFLLYLPTSQSGILNIVRNWSRKGIMSDNA